MTKIHHSFIEVDKLRPWKEYSCGVCSLTGGIPGAGSCEPTSFVYNGLDGLVTVPTDPNPRLYYKVQVQIDNDPPTEHTLVNDIPDDRCSILFVQLILAIFDTPVTVVGDITAYDGDGIPYNYSADFGEFGLTHDQNSATIYGYPASPDGVLDRSTTLTFLTPSQAELDAYSIANEVTAVDGANFLFAEYPTIRSCSYIPAE